MIVEKEFIINEGTGIGINDEIFSNLFSKFTTMPTKEGTGLGLYISKSIVEAHGGKIWAKNNDDGRDMEYSQTRFICCTILSIICRFKE